MSFLSRLLNDNVLTLIDFATKLAFLSVENFPSGDYVSLPVGPKIKMVADHQADGAKKKKRVSDVNVLKGDQQI